MSSNKSGLLKALIDSPHRPKHNELPAGFGGVTLFDTTTHKVRGIETPPDALIRVHEMMHVRHTNPDIRWSDNDFVRNIIEDIRLHANHWPWPIGQTPATIANAGKAQLEGELASIAKSLAPSPDNKITLEQRGQGFGMMLRDTVALKAINGEFQPFPDCFSSIERHLANRIYNEIRAGNYDLAAALYEAAFFSEKKKKEGEKGDESESDESDEDTKEEKARKAREKKARKELKAKDKEEGRGPRKGHGKPAPTICTIDETGPFIDPCGDPQDTWTLATSGARICRHLLRRPVLPQRIFMRRRPVAPGGATIIDASGSMGLSVEDIVTIIDSAPMATLALYSGNDNTSAPIGKIFVAAKDGFRRSKEQIIAYVKSRPRGNSVDLEAIDWLMRLDGPRTMITDRAFCGSRYSDVALAKLEHYETQGEITVYHPHKDRAKIIPAKGIV